MPQQPSQTSADPDLYRAPARFVDSDSAPVQAFVRRALAARGVADEDMTARAICLFDAVRDGLRYDPYAFSPDPEDYRASAIASMAAGFCVPKAILLAACLRAAGIPAALGFADVRNHLNSPKLRETMGTDLFIYHGYVQLWLGAQSYKVTPAFNMELCARFGVRPLVFDGRSDALFHEYDAGNRRHMEYVHDRGLFVDFPADAFFEQFYATYPKLIAQTRNDARRGAQGRDAAFGTQP